MQLFYSHQFLHSEKIGHLKSELKQKKMEMKQDKLHIESLELEAKYLKSRQKDNER